MSVRLIIDSTANVAENLRHRFTVLPLTLRFGNEEYLDGVTITGEEFYRKLVSSDVSPTTSQATPFQFGEIFREAVEAGDDVVAIVLSSELSGTCQSAMVAAEAFPGKVHVVDSRNVAIGSGILAEYALQLADAGKGAAEIAEAVTAARSRVRLVAMVNTLEYLKRGGRVSKTVAFAGELLNIKPIIGVIDGKVEILGKARGAKAANTMLTREIVGRGGVDCEMPVMLGYTGLSDAALQKYITDHAELWPEDIGARTTTICSVIGAHAGPDAVAAAYFAKN